MAPPLPSTTLQPVETHLQKTIQTLYELLVSLHAFSGPETTNAIANNISSLVSDYQKLSTIPIPADIMVPLEVVTRYVEIGRNPDIYTRDFVELVQKQNQVFKGKVAAFRGFRDTLVEQVIAAFPELTDEVEKIVANTGG